MTLSKAKLKATIVHSVGSELGVRGFDQKRSSDTFVRVHDGMTDIFQLVFLDGKPGWTIQPNVAVRIERVEQIFHEFSGFDAKLQKSTPTIGASVGVLLEGDARACEFRVESESDIAAAIGGIIKIFDSVALDYFGQFSSISAVDQELNGRPCERTPNRAVPWLRYSSGLIVAKLANRANFAELEDIYTEAIMKISNGFYGDKFKLLLDRLKSI